MRYVYISINFHEFVYNSFTFQIDYVIGSSTSLGDAPPAPSEPDDHVEDELTPLVIAFKKRSAIACDTHIHLWLTFKILLSLLSWLLVLELHTLFSVTLYCITFHYCIRLVLLHIICILNVFCVISYAHVIYNKQGNKSCTGYTAYIIVLYIVVCYSNVQCIQYLCIYTVMHAV